MRIPDSWRTEYAYNCLTDEEFALLQDKYEVDYEFLAHCSECETYTLHKHHRCDCGNRRCYLQYDEQGNFFYCEVD